MRFTRYCLKRRPIEWTPRKVAAAARAARREVERVALFPELARIRTAEDRIAQIEQDHTELVARMRVFRAKSWRRARALRRQLNPFARAGVDRLWNRGTLPADPTYLLGMIREARYESPWKKLRELASLAAAGQLWRQSQGWE